jgi:signal transduction histidine kinase
MLLSFPTLRELGKNAGMSTEPIDPQWPKLLSLAVHEFRTPITVASGYLRMVLKERVGPISDQQRKLLEEAEKSCGRLSALVAELSDLSALEGGRAVFNPAAVDLNGLLAEEVASLPDLPDRVVTVELETNGAVNVPADTTRLRAALTALVGAIRREVVSADRLIIRVTGSRPGSMCVVVMGAPDEIDTFATAAPGTLERFDEFRGGSGLSLAIARRVIGQHGGSVFAPPGGQKAGAVILLPQA